MRALLLLALLAVSMAAQPLRIIAIGAHPDDCDIKFGGTAVLLAKMGHQVKFVSVTNGDAGHHEMGGQVLANRRRAEAAESARRLGIAEYEVMENHDGELTPSLDVRRQIIRAIRNWKADVVITHRTNDYHPDHRNTGILIQDAAYLVQVPNIVSDAPALRKNPVFLYFSDYFQRPNPFRPDIVVDIEAAFEQKINGLDAHVSQFYEWLPWVSGVSEKVPKDPAARKAWLRDERANQRLNDEAKASYAKWYGASKTPKYLEAFEICEYGRRPTEDEIRKLFPMLPKK
ncbi:MAG: GlcNAc-PI de-N-acetylase [Acidobacteriia bacterium 12-62-4]|nr:MAG: GlcNAc-PI de-N-acetylase [Acidobacteriia bacterium 12-62-4]